MQARCHGLSILVQPDARRAVPFVPIQMLLNPGFVVPGVCREIKQCSGIQQRFLSKMLLPTDSPCGKETDDWVFLCESILLKDCQMARLEGIQHDWPPGTQLRCEKKQNLGVRRKQARTCTLLSEICSIQPIIPGSESAAVQLRMSCQCHT